MSLQSQIDALAIANGNLTTSITALTNNINGKIAVIDAALVANTTNTNNMIAQAESDISSKVSEADTALALIDAPKTGVMKAIADTNRHQRYRSGFLDFGLDTTYSNRTIVNQGLSVNLESTALNSVWLGYGLNTTTPGRPIIDAMGYEYELKNMGSGSQNRLIFPTAGTIFPTGTWDGVSAPVNQDQQDIKNGHCIQHADSTNSGLINNATWAVSGTGVSESNGVITFSNASSAYVKANNDTAIVIGDVAYILEYRVTTTFTGDLLLANFGTSSPTIPSTLGKHRIQITPDDDSVIRLYLHGNASGAIKDLSIFPAHVEKRTDLGFLEFFTEDVTDRDFVYDNGVIQDGNSTSTISGATKVLGSFSGYDTYSLYGSHQFSGSMVGYGYVWSTLSDTQKRDFMNNPKNRIERDGVNIIQRRVRGRTDYGLGDHWETIDPSIRLYDSSYAALRYQHTDGSIFVYAQGKQDTAEPLAHHGDNNVFWNTDIAGQDMSHVETDMGIYSVRKASHITSSNAECYALPLMLVKRYNRGAFHPVYNGRGTTRIRTLTGVSRPWLDSDAINITKTIDTFNPTMINENQSSPGDAYDTVLGNVSSGYNGGGKVSFYDNIEDSMVTDLRLGTEKLNDPDITLQHLSANGARGNEGDWNITTLLFSQKTTSNPARAIHIPLKSSRFYSVGDKILIMSTESGVREYVTLTSTGTDGGGTYDYIAWSNSGIPINRQINDRYSVSKMSSGMNSGSMTHTDIIGDPRFYPKTTVAYETISGSLVRDIVVGDKIKVAVASTSTGVGTVGNYYVSIVDQASEDLNTADFTDAALWVDTGSTNDVSWQEDIANGYTLAGDMLVVGEEGEDYIDLASSSDTYQPAATRIGYGVKMSDKMINAVGYGTNGQTLEMTPDPSNNISYSNVASHADFENNNKNVTSASNTHTTNKIYIASDNANRAVITFLTYKTSPNPLEPTVNTKVEDMKITDVVAVTDDNVRNGNILMSSLINKIGVSTVHPYKSITKLSNYFIDGNQNNILYTSAVYPLEHGPVKISQSNPAVKTFAHATEEGVNLIFKEMKWDSDLDDGNSEFNTVTESNTSWVSGEYYHVTDGSIRGYWYCNISPGVTGLANIVFSQLNDTLINDIGTVYFTRWDGNGWGDNNKFEINDNVTAVTDLNGVEVLSGIKKVILKSDLR